MATIVGKVVTKKVLAKEFGPADPYYETYIDDEGKKNRRQRALPPGLSKRDASILQSVQKSAHRLDEGFQICGLDVGWTFVIGIVPVIGDAVNLALGHSLVVKKAKKADVSASLLREMKSHNLISAGMGMVPAIGDICVAVYKPNSRNATLLEEFLTLRGEEALRLNPEGNEGSVNSTPSGQRRRTWFRRSQKKTGQVNSVSTSSMNTPAGTGATEPKNNPTVDGSPTPGISSSSKNQLGHGT